MTRRRAAAAAAAAVAFCLLCPVASGEPLPDFIAAMKHTDFGGMANVVRDNRRELNVDFFAMLQHAADVAGRSSDEAANYMTVAAALAMTFEQVSPDDLRSAFIPGRVLLSGAARGIFTDHDLTVFLIERTRQLARGDTSGMNDVRSIVNAYLITRARAEIERREQQEKARREDLALQERQRARKADIARLASVADVAGLRTALADREADRDDRKAIMSALAKAGDRQTVLNAIPDPVAVEAAADLTPAADVVDVLAPLLADPREPVRSAASTSLRRIGEHPRLPWLMMNAANIDLRLTVARFLDDLHYQPANEAQRACVLFARGRLADSAAAGAPAHELARHALRSKDNAVVVQALSLLSLTGSHGDLAAVRPLLGHSSGQVKSAARSTVRSLYGYSPAALLEGEWVVDPLFRYLYLPGMAVLLVSMRKAIARRFLRQLPTAW